MAEGGVNAALGNVDPEDSWEFHFKDTVKGGSWINNQKLVEILTREAPERILDLEEYGALFDRTPEGKIVQRPFGKQSYRRTCYASDRTGHEFMATLVEEVRRRDINVMEEIFVTNLLKANGTVVGAFGIEYKTGAFTVFRAKATVLAAGGTGRIYKTTSNAAQDTGDGYAIGYRAGASLIDMEMFQFHPTGMVFPESAKGRLVTEGVRGEGGILTNINNERFMKRYDPRLELAGRDVVARANATEIIEGRGTPHGGVYLSISHIDAHIIEDRLKTMLRQFLDTGIDIRKEPMEVAPTAHHLMGGLMVNEEAATNLRGLWAAGEVTGGIQGGNRLGGNALVDTQVFGKIAGENAAKYAQKVDKPSVDLTQVGKEIKHARSSLERREGIRPVQVRTKLANLMWDKVGIFRTGKELQEAVSEIERMQREEIPRLYATGKGTRYNHEWIKEFEVENMVLTAEMIARAALMRQETRGAHYRKDFPKTDNKNWFANIVIKRENGKMTFKKIPVVLTLLKPEA
jgi:fumarate reductase (CoM/CoB) subunit A